MSNGLAAWRTGEDLTHAPTERKDRMALYYTLDVITAVTGNPGTRRPDADGCVRDVLNYALGQPNDATPPEGEALATARANLTAALTTTDARFAKVADEATEAAEAVHETLEAWRTIWVHRFGATIDVPTL